MKTYQRIPAIALACLLMCLPAAAQTSSIGARKRTAEAANPRKTTPREAPKIRRNLVYERYSWITAKPVPPKTFKVHDLITVVVQHRSNYEADHDMQTKKKWDLSSQLDAFIKFTGGGLGAAQFQRGKPNIDFQFQNKLRNEGELDREDRLTTRITTEIIDIKPNGNLVLQGKGRLRFDDEVTLITLTGACRKQDVTADNTILSTQVAELNIDIKNSGALRKASGRGWIPRLIDWLNPI